MRIGTQVILCVALAAGGSGNNKQTKSWDSGEAAGELMEKGHFLGSTLGLDSNCSPTRKGRIQAFQAVKSCSG